MWRLLSSKILKTNNEKGFEVLSVKLYFQCKKLAGIEHVAAGGGFTTANSGKGLSRAIPGIQADPFGSFLSRHHSMLLINFTQVDSVLRL